MRLSGSGALAILTLLGCQEPRWPALTVQMDSALFGRDSTGHFHATFGVANLGSGPAYLQGCPSPSTVAMDTGSDGRWSEYLFAGSCGGDLLPTETIERQVLQPGQSYRDVFTWDWPGRYRIRVFFGPEEANPYSLQAVGAAFVVP